jgi:ABC-type Fe3+ transport system permease subunit
LVLSLAAATLAGLPLVALLLRSLPPHSLLAAWTTGWQEIATSLLVATFTATLLVAVALPLSRPGSRWSTVAGTLCAGAWLASGPVFGVGLIATWNHAGLPGWVYDHFPILVIATAGRLAVFAWLGASVVWAWWPREAVEAARNLGASPARVLGTVAWPLLRRPLFALWAVVAMLALGEVETLALVAPPGWVPVSLRIFTLMHYGPAALVSALALLQALAAGATIIAVGTLGQYGEFYTRSKSRYDVRGEEHA